MKKSLIKINQAIELPSKWDSLADCHFQTKEFYEYTEMYNPCNQRYYLLYEGDILRAGACVYDIVLDLLTFIRIKSPVKMHIVGIPATVSPKGIIGDEKWIQKLLKEIFNIEKGLLVGMNIPPDMDCAPAVSIRNMPTISMKHQFINWKDYQQSLRSNYRRRLKKNTRSFKGVKKTVSDCSIFDENLYGLYEQIFDRSKSKVEKLTLQFFKNLPPKYRLTVYTMKEQILAWHVILKDEDIVYFFFGGTNYKLNNQYNSYFNNIAGIIEEALEIGCSEIELGQTAEIPKTRLGGEVIPLNLFLYHRNKIINFLLSIFKALLQYNRSIPATHVFKNE